MNLPAYPLHARQRRRRLRRALLWGSLVALLLIAQSLLLVLTLSHEAASAQESVDLLAASAAAEIKRDLAADQQRLQALLINDARPQAWGDGVIDLMRARREVLRVERRDNQGYVVAAVSSPTSAPLFNHFSRAQLEFDTEVACANARRTLAPLFSRSYFVPLPGGFGLEVIDLCVPHQVAGHFEGFLVATFSMSALLEAAVSAQNARLFEISFVEGDGTRIARAGLPRGAGVYHAERVVDLPGQTLQLRVDSPEGRPRLIPNLATALVLGLSLALFALVLLLVRDVRRRARAEAALAEALAFRKAMEDSLSTGLRARDLEGRISYVNPAFCAMVGFAPDELLGLQRPPYWPADRVDEYQRRQTSRLQTGALGDARTAKDAAGVQEPYETVFVRKSGEQFPVLIYEAPLVDGEGGQSGWMSAVIDMSAQRKIEEISRQQQDRLQATARLATVGEMASLLSHEINQPLAAIASYASGSLNLIGDDQDLAPLRQAVTRIAEQAERAGRVIKSVHDFVRRRDSARESMGADQLLDAVLPLIRLQARKSGARIAVELPRPAPRVVCDRTMLEQVLLNLTRNALQAMEPDTPVERRLLRLRASVEQGGRVEFQVIDAGKGISPEVGERLFTPFFTTRADGMGLGLSLCRTVIEQHGGQLDFEPAPGGGTVFRFTLPAPGKAAVSP